MAAKLQHDSQLPRSGKCSEILNSTSRRNPQSRNGSRPDRMAQSRSNPTPCRVYPISQIVRCHGRASLNQHLLDPPNFTKPKVANRFSFAGQDDGAVR